MAAEIELRDRRKEYRGGTFRFRKEAAAAAAASNLEGITQHLRFAQHGRGKDAPRRLDALELRCAPDALEEVVRIVVEAGGENEEERRPWWEKHSDPASLKDGYEPPAGFKARLEHIEKLRERLSRESYDIDYFYSKESKLVLRLGGVTIPLGELPPADVDALCGEVERFEELVKLARRLLTLVE